MKRNNTTCREPVAIVGFAFQFPQGAVDEETFWEKLMNRECTSTEFPKDRINVKAFHSSEVGSQGTVSTIRRRDGLS
jgi:acyl transferase domain-containing protein